MLYVLRGASSIGARALVDGLMDAGTPAKRWNDARPRTPVQGDKVICWGDQVEPIEGVTYLNNVPSQTKLNDAIKLRDAGIATIEFAVERPAPLPAGPDPALSHLDSVRYWLEEFDANRFARDAVYTNAVRQTLGAFGGLLRALEEPIPPQVAAEWLGRRNNHVGGSDLLAPPANPDFYVRKEDIREEYRIHVFKNKSIRAGQKRPRPDHESHQWIRSFDGGWFIDYSNFESTPEMRALAIGAVKALSLDFGAVDLARKADGMLIVLEVNRAPGLEGNTVLAYVNAVQRWLNG